MNMIYVLGTIPYAMIEFHPGRLLIHALCVLLSILYVPRLLGFVNGKKTKLSLALGLLSLLVCNVPFFVLFANSQPDYAWVALYLSCIAAFSLMELAVRMKPSEV